MNSIEAFADQMRALGVENNYGRLSAWGEQLGLQADLFDLVAISAKLEGYPELIGQMQGNGESRSMMAVSIETQRVAKPGRPNKRFDLTQRVITLFIAMTTDSYDIYSDGQRFLLAQQEKGSEQPEIAVTVVQNWYKELHVHK